MSPSSFLGDVASALVARGIVGVALAVRGPDGFYADAAAGTADRSRSLPMTADRQFRIASISKMFVFGTVLKLCEEGRLHLDAPIAGWVPDLPFADQVTLRHILMQTGGLPVWATDRIDEVPVGADRWTPRQVIDFHYARTPATEPGGPMVYANVGSRLAAYIVECATGERIGELIQRRFLDPLKLSDTTPSGASLTQPARLARGYYIQGDAEGRDATGAVPSAWLWAGGDMYSTVADLTRWAHAFFGGGVFGPDMTSALFNTLAPGGFHGSTLSAHGLGVMVFTRHHDVFGYRGSTPGFVSILGYEPSARIAVSVLTNSFSPVPSSILRSGVESAMFQIIEELPN